MNLLSKFLDFILEVLDTFEVCWKYMFNFFRFVVYRLFDSRYFLILLFLAFFYWGVNKHVKDINDFAFLVSQYKELAGIIKSLLLLQE